MMKRFLSMLMAVAMLLCSAAALADTEGSGSLSILSTEPNTLNMIQSESNLDADVF